IEGLESALVALEDKGLRVTAERSQHADSVATSRSFTLELVGHDRPGIVREISQAIAQRGVNVERLNTECVSGSMSAEMLFKAYAELSAPDSLELDDLQAALEAIENDLMVDITLN
ncbi:MAG: glycine cleavage system protein R, partial [Pontibacterium sp.]